VNRPRLLLGATFFACALSSAARAFAGDPVPVDAWPLRGAGPAADAGSARAAIDAAAARRQSITMGRVASAFDESVVVADPGVGGGGPGRATISPAVALRGLRVASDRSREADRRTVPEMVQVLASVAFDGTAVDPSRPVLPGPLGVDRIFKQGFQPASIDDRPYVLQPSRLDRLRRFPPAPPPPDPAEPVNDGLVKGVKVEVDEGLLRRALAGADVPTEEAALDELEERLLAAADGDAAAVALAGFVTERKRALLERLQGEGGLRRVSLRALLGDGKTTDPDATCGGLTRILGVACDVAGGDVTLVGVIEPGAPPVLLDTLALALRTVWREGRVPGCSLDPDPSNPGGPQNVRVLGVPGDSRFAKVMLEADYAMKKIVARAPGGEHGVEGLVDLPAAFERLGGEIGNNRFWLTPVPPNEGDVLSAPAEGPASFGPGAPAALFEARVRVRTEGMRAAALGGEQGLGRSAPAAEACARSFSERYDELAVRMPVFAELRTLFDAVTCAQVLRILAPRHPLLTRAADRAYAKADIPRSYPGVTVTTALSSGFVTLQGGCDLDPRVTRNAFVDVPHPAFASLARRSPDGALPGARPVAVGAAREAEDVVLAATQLLATERYAEARDALSDVLDVRPGDAEVLALRATARFHAAEKAGPGVAGARGAGERERALLEAEEASLLDPASPGLEGTWRHLRLLSGDPTALEKLHPAVAEALEARYSVAAASLALGGDWAEALTWSARAVKVRPNSVSARVLRATLLWLSDDLIAATGVAAEAAALDPSSPEPLEVSAWIALQRGDSRAAVSALDRVVALTPDAEAFGMRAVARVLEGDLASGADDAARAVALDPAERAGGLAIQCFRGMAVYGPEKGRALARAQLMLPASVQLAIYTGQQAMEGRQPRAALEEGKIPPDRLQTSLAVETVSFLVARAAMDLVREDPEAADRIEVRASAVAAMHPDWISPHWIRVLAAQKAGRVVEALGHLARCREGDPADDELLQQSVPRDAAAFRQILSILEVSLLFGAPAEEGERRMPDALGRLVEAYRGTSSAAAAEGVKAALDAMREKADPAKAQAIRADLRAHAARLAPPGSGPLAPAEAMVRAFFQALLVGVEADAGGDPVATLKTLAALAPTPDIYDPVQGVLVSARHEALKAAIAALFAGDESRFDNRALLERAIVDGAGARAFLERVFRPLRERAASSGDPILAWQVEETAVEAGEGVLKQAKAERLRRIEQVLEVALDTAKVVKLAAARDALKAELEREDAAAKARLLASRKTLLTALKTPSDVKTLQALLATRREGREPAPEIGPGLDDARRLQQVTLAACLRALNVPLPESLK
jgi:tetratricopeptide (TPR) repeat protein